MRTHIKAILILICCGQVYPADADLAALRNFIAARAGLETYRGDTKCATRYQLDIIRHWDELSLRDQSLWLTDIKQDTIRSEKLITPSGHFMLHWDNSGIDAVPQTDLSGNGIPDYIDSAAVIFDLVWDTEINQMGYPAPPGADGNPVSIYHIYFTDFEYYGVTWFDEQLVIDNMVKYTSHMEVDNDFSEYYFYSPGLNGLKVSAAHEFHHAIQFGYNVRQTDFFFYEMTSTWMEEYVYPEINDYRQYLNEFFADVSNTPFNYYNQFTVFPYGNFLYVLMLNQIYDADIVRIIWNDMLGRTSLDALRNVLAADPYNSSWLSSLEEYGKWLYYTGERYVPGSYFSDAEDFPEIRIGSTDSYIFPDQIPETVDVTELTNRYIRLIGLRGADLNLLVTASTFNDGGFRLLSGLDATGFYPLGETFGTTNLTVDTVVVQLVNAQISSRDYGIDVSSKTSTEIAIGPNPVRIGSGDREVLFRNIPDDGHIYIFNAIGLEVAHLEEKASPTRVWNLTNRNGETVASGIYIYLVKSQKKEYKGKLAVVR